MSKIRHTEVQTIGAEATGGESESGRCGTRSTRVEAHDLRLESEVRRDGWNFEKSVPGM